MGTAERTKARQGPWVGRIATRIRDPVLRLRFLKTVAPAPLTRRSRRSRFYWLAAVVIAALALLVSALLFSRLRASEYNASRPLPASRVGFPLPLSPSKPTSVWLVEESDKSESYSNGLRLDNHFLTATHQRRYRAFPAGGGSPANQSEPAGIVFHTTESMQAPFEANENGILKQFSRSVLEFVRRHAAYNFVIDRFGRVYRIVPEDQAANHSGYSVWANDRWMYVNLNESFLAVSFEAASPAGAERAPLSPAQIRSAAMLIEMLRCRYHIAAANCVTHAQVSVNPENMRVGLHVDWASGFPFTSVGLPDNYATSLPAIWAYGFEADASFSQLAGTGLHLGIDKAQETLENDAEGEGLRPVDYRKKLRRRYRQILAQAMGSRYGSIGSR
jgi:hypothetical protein